MWERRHSFYKQSIYKIRRNFIFIPFAIFSFFSLSLGVGLCLIKSPESKSDYYLALSAHYQSQLSDQDVALQVEAQNYLLKASGEAVLKSIYYTPYNVKAWQQLSSLLQYLQNTQKAAHAFEIVKTLGATEIPAFLPSRDFASSNATFYVPDNKTAVQ